MQKSKMSIKKPTISIITPFFNEQEVVDIYFIKVINILKKIGFKYQIICIDDGSQDQTLELLKTWQKKEPTIKIIAFSRNFGKEAALSAGLEHVTNQVTIPIDADLQDPPELIPEMIKRWQEGNDVVLAKRKTRNDGVVRNLAATIYYKFLSWLTNGNIVENVGDFRLMDIKVVSALKSMTERNRYMKGLFAWVGFKSTTIYYNRPKRIQGKTKLGFMKLLKLACDGIFSFSTKPLKVWLYLGLIVSLFSFIYATFLVIKTTVYGKDLPGYASLMVSILFIGGLQLVSLGVIAEYIARIFKEVKHRPIFIVDKTYEIKTETRSKQIKDNSKKKQSTKTSAIPQ